MKYSCLVFSEGGSDKKFLMALVPLLEEYHTNKWSFNYDNASGSSPETILKKCQSVQFVDAYNLVMCFIDLDKLKTDFPKTWESEKQKLEQKYSKFKIMWQINNLEEEIKKVLGDMCCGKHKLNIIARRKIKQFKNSDLWKRILKTIKDREQEIEQP